MQTACTGTEIRTVRVIIFYSWQRVRVGWFNGQRERFMAAKKGDERIAGLGWH
jgi:hypothetical protein